MDPWKMRIHRIWLREVLLRLLVNPKGIEPTYLFVIKLKNYGNPNTHASSHGPCGQTEHPRIPIVGTENLIKGSLPRLRGTTRGH